MVNNTTSILNQYITLVNERIVIDDSMGAIIFIIFVLLWYSSSIVFLMGMQIGRSNEILDDSTKRQGKLFVRRLRDQSNNKEILKELVDKQKRDKLWDIYLGTSGDMNDKITRADILRIRNIEKRLATLNEDHRDSYQRILDDDFITHSDLDLCSSTNDSCSPNSRLRIRRRSSLDQKILEEWKVLAEEIKAHENWPWAIRKLLIRRHLKRQRYTTE